MINHFLVGIPGSGKSTWARQLTRSGNHGLISSDRLREQLYGQAQIQGHWPEIEGLILHQARHHWHQGRGIIYDATNVQRPWRRDILQKFQAIAPPDLSPKWIAWVLESPVTRCLQRNRWRSRQVPETVIRTMARQLCQELPQPSEGFQLVITLANF